MTIGRPIIPDSERQREPWKELGVSRATFYWKKRYGDLPKDTRAYKARMDSKLQNTPWRSILKKAQKR